MEWLANSRVPSGGTRGAAAAPNVGSEWSVRMTSGPKVCSASRNPRSESTRRVAPVIPARRSSRSTSAASSATSSTIRTRTSPGIVSARLLVQEQPVQPDVGDGARERLKVHGLDRSEEHTSELQSLAYLVCRLLLEKKKKTKATIA